MAERSKAAVLKTVIQQCIGGSNPSRSVSFDDAWRRGRAVIQRIANPSVPKGLGRFNSCRLRIPDSFSCLCIMHEIVAQLD